MGWAWLTIYTNTIALDQLLVMKYMLSVYVHYQFQKCKILSLMVSSALTNFTNINVELHHIDNVNLNSSISKSPTIF